MTKKDIYVPTDDQISSLNTNLLKYAEYEGTNLEYEAFLDAHGHLVLRTKEPIDLETRKNLIESSTIPLEWINAVAYLGTKIITLPLEDARTIYRILGEKIMEYGSSSEAFGESGISCERLLDCINGTIYRT